MAWGNDAEDRHDMMQTAELISDDGTVLSPVAVVKSQLPKQLRGFVDLDLQHLDPDSFPTHTKFMGRFVTGGTGSRRSEEVTSPCADSGTGDVEADPAGGRTVYCSICGAGNGHDADCSVIS